MELPPYHLPTLRGVLLRTWDRVRLFLREAGRIIVLMVLALYLLGSIGTDGHFGRQDSDESILAAASRSATSLFAPMGIEEDNWPAVLGVFSGVLAKEVIVGTLDTLYGRLAAESTGPEQPESFDLVRDLGLALASVKDNLGALGERLTDPLGLRVADVSDLDAAAADQGVRSGTFGAMAARFDGRAGAFAYLLFVLLYFPCVATVGAIVREAGAPWAGFVALWTTGVAYLTATVFYQAATFGRDPLGSGIWIAGSLLLFGLTLGGLRFWAQNGRSTAGLAQAGSRPGS
jgi:ferrous iron transport protein B